VTIVQIGIGGGCFTNATADCPTVRHQRKEVLYRGGVASSSFLTDAFASHYKRLPSREALASFQGRHNGRDMLGSYSIAERVLANKLGWNLGILEWMFWKHRRCRDRGVTAAPSGECRRRGRSDGRGPLLLPYRIDCAPIHQ
jgi:hypothetical protein